MNTYRDPLDLSAGVSQSQQQHQPSPVPLSDREVGHGYIGLANQGCTCYLSSMLQFLFHIGYFRSAVYETSIAEEDPSPIPRALQELFFQMQERQTTGSTVGLTSSFGWSESEVFVQHDIHEMVTKLREVLEEKMKGTRSEGAINRLFEGKAENVIKTLDGSYTSSRPETFYDIMLCVTGFKDLYSSLESHMEKTQLVGDCKYKVEIEGEETVYKDAEKGYRFIRFPPVMCFHLKRFEMDMYSPDLETKKVNSYFGFPEVLDLTEFETGEDAEQQQNAPTAEPSSTTAATAEDSPSTSTSNINKAASSSPISASDFSKATPPIYDLHTVIVHRGGYGSGHYYCYVRMFDTPPKATNNTTSSQNAESEDGEAPTPAQPLEGGQWFEFDDEHVRMVKAQVAIANNYGGDRATYANGGGLSAYVLVYLRRGFLSELLKEASPEVIPQRAKDELRRVMREDERLAKEAAEAKRKVHISFVDDNHIFEHVRTNTTDLVRGKVDDANRDSSNSAQYAKRSYASTGSPTHPPGLNKSVIYNHLKVDKTASLASLYKELALVHGYQPQHIRLWSWGFHFKDKTSLRPEKALPLYSPDSSMAIDAAIGEALGLDEAAVRERFKDKPMSVFLYVEQRREIIPPSSGNILATSQSGSDWIDTGFASTSFPLFLIPEGARSEPQPKNCFKNELYRFAGGQKSIFLSMVFKKPCLVADTAFVVYISSKEYEVAFMAYAELFSSKEDVKKSSKDPHVGTRLRSFEPKQQESSYNKSQYACSQQYQFEAGTSSFRAEAVRFTVIFNRAIESSPGLCVRRIQTASCLTDPLFNAVAKDVCALPREKLIKEAVSTLNGNGDVEEEEEGHLTKCKGTSLSARFAAQQHSNGSALSSNNKNTNSTPHVDSFSVGLTVRAALPAYNEQEDLMLFVKLYSPSGGNGDPVRYLGPLTVSKVLALRDYQAIILRMMGMPTERHVAPRLRKELVSIAAATASQNNQQRSSSSSSSAATSLVLSDESWRGCYEPKLLFFDESTATQVSVLDSAVPISNQNIHGGNVIIVQLAVELIPSINRFPTAISYYNNINSQRMVTIRLHNDPSNPLVQLVMSGHWSYGEVCDYIAIKLSELLAEMDEESATYSSPPDGSPNSNLSSPSSKAALLSSSKKKKKQIEEEDAPPASCYFDSEYLRLYSTCDLINPKPAPDPIRSSSSSTLDQYLEINGSGAQDLFVEILDQRRSVLETMTSVTLIPVDVFGCPYLGGGESIAGTTSSSSAPAADATTKPAATSTTAASTAASPPPTPESDFAHAAAAEEVSMLLPPKSTFRDIVCECFVQTGFLRRERGVDGRVHLVPVAEGFQLAPHYTIVGVMQSEPSRPVILHDHIYMDPTLPSDVPSPDLFSRHFRFVLMATEPLPGYDPVKQEPKWEYEHFMDRPDPRKHVRIMCSHTDIVDVAYYRRAKLWGTPFLVTVSFATNTDECMKLMCGAARVQIDSLVSGTSKNLAVLLYTDAALHFNEVIPVVQYLKHTRSSVSYPSILVLNHKRPKKAALLASSNRHRETSLVLEKKKPTK